MTAVQTDRLTKNYRSKRAVSALNLEIKEGELFALLGVNGAGKSTTIQMLSCLIVPTSGDASILGNSIVTQPQKVKQQISVSPQETAVAPNLTVRENLELFASIYGRSPAQAREKAEQVIRDFGMTDIARSKAKTLSGGWQRRLSIALALISEPKVLFLDEPTLGLDVLARRELWHVIQELKGRVTILLTTHYMEEAEALADRIGIMAQGELEAVGTAAELKARAGAETLEDAFIVLAGAGRAAG